MIKLKLSLCVMYQAVAGQTRRRTYGTAWKVIQRMRCLPIYK